ncbi:single-stranded DNA-binding protein [Anaplasmataceae bacterium AB001_6]|nr:single-stranded DNA-binding protein [Anaplasmataceae bacterium AB001_6]
MTSLNKVLLMGRLGKDPEIRTMNNSKQMATFSIATSNFWIDRDTNERKESTEWHNIVVYKENIVSLCQKYIKKGSLIYLEGILKTRKWVDSNNNNRYTTEIILNNSGDLKMLETKRNEGFGNNYDAENSSTTENSSGNNVEKNIVDIDDEIPF